MPWMLFPLLWLAIAPGPTTAQFVPAPGDRVRVTQTGGTRLTGVLESWTDESLRLTDGRTGATRTIPISAVAELERSLGRRRNVGKYVAISGGVGALAGLIVGASVEPCVERGGWYDCFLQPTTRRGAVTLGVVGGFLVGTLPGFLIGLTTEDEAWLEAGLPSRSAPRLVVAPMVDGSMSVGLALTF